MSTLSGTSPCAAKACASAVTSSTIASAAIAFAAALARASPANSGSISTRLSLIPVTRRASASPAVPMPAPRSTTRSPARASVAAASKMASWPARWPDRFCFSSSCPPRKASSVMSAAATVIAAQFVAEAGLGQELPGLLGVVLMDQDPARQNAERALDDAHVLVQHQMMDLGAVEQRAYC